LGYLLRINFKLWAYLLGALFLSLTSLTVYRLGSTLFPQRKEFPLIAGVFCSLEWHLVWAAFSGMETMLFTFLSLLLIEQCLRYEPRFRIGGFLLKGLTGGLLTLTRPEGVILFAITFLLHLAFVNKLRAEKVASAILLCIGFAIPFLPYIALNLTTTGLAFPSSFYAKQKEYRAMAEGLPFASRIFRVIKPTLVGAQALLLPGFFYGMYKKFKEFPSSLSLGLLLSPCFTPGDCLWTTSMAAMLCPSSLSSSYMAYGARFRFFSSIPLTSSRGLLAALPFSP
jgi:hypothetical protein